jgi:hypothetical protein
LKKPACVDGGSQARDDTNSLIGHVNRFKGNGKRPKEPTSSPMVKFAGTTATSPDNPRRERSMDKLNKSFFSPSSLLIPTHRIVTGNLQREIKSKERKEIKG